MKKYFFLLALLYTTLLFSQSSFVKTIDYNFSIPLFGLEIGTNDELSVLDMLGFSGPETHFKIINLSSDGKFNSGFSINIDSIPLLFGYKHFHGVDDYRLVSFTTSISDGLISGIFCLNIENGSFWTRESSIFNNTLLPASVSKNNDFVLSVQDLTENSFDPKVGIATFDIETGDPIWAFRYFPTLNPSSGLAMQRTAEHLNGDISFTLFTLGLNQFGNSGLVTLSPDGTLLNNVIIEADTREILFLDDQNYGVDELGNSYVVGLDLKEIGVDTLIPFIAKFDSNLDLVWAKQLFAENFPYEGLNHRVFPNGEVVFVYNTTGDLPVIVGKLDTDGNLLWHRGYSFYNPEIQIGSDGSIYFLSPRRYFPDGTSEPALLLAKADPDGDIEDCPQFDACLTLFDMDIPYTRWDWSRESLDDTLGRYNTAISPLTTSTEDYCGTPARPTAFFSLPDTICQNTTLRPDSLNNSLAHAVEWTVTGQDTILEIVDASWQFQFTEPGNYQIEQEVWLLGCSEFFTKNLTVLPDSLGDLLGADQLICVGDSITLSPSATRPLKDFEWQDGTIASSITASSSGIYTVEVSDGFCSTSDQITLTAFEDRYPAQAINLSDMTTICEESVPFILKPSSPYTDSFNLNNQRDSSFELAIAGNYLISTTIENCLIEETFNLEITPCEVDIYIPNSFSPNNDGINDSIEPLGRDFSGISLEIYNRWGGKIFETQTTPFAWDGNFDNQKTDEGVYVLVFKYQNQRNGVEGTISRDVLLVR